jgi:membrane-associated protease RseP (regulator of RpoE activity)
MCVECFFGGLIKWVLYCETHPTKEEKVMSLSQLRGCVEWALMVTLVFGAGAIARAQDAETPSEDSVIQIGPADDAAMTDPQPGDEQAAAQPATPHYWIGLLGGPVSEELLHHVDLPKGQGLLVRDVLPDGPAAEAGLEQFDIMVRANDKELTDMRDLVELVRTADPEKGPIAIEVLRHGKRETVQITPVERPANIGGPRGGFGGFGGPGQDPRDIFRWFEEHQGSGGEGRPFGEGGFGRGGFGMGRGMEGVPNGVSISVERELDQPVRVTVKRGDESWEVVGNDPKSLEQLPEDLRPFVERLLHGGLGRQNPVLPPGPAGDPGELNQRLEEMQRQLEELQQRVLGGEDPSTEEAQ